MTDEQINKMAVDNARDIAALKQGQAALERRIDENDRVTTGIHKLAANMENLTAEVKRLGERLETGLREQGKRIGQVETAVIEFANIKANLKTALDRLDNIEKEPATKWKNLMWLIIGGVTTAIVGYFMAKLF